MAQQLINIGHSANDRSGDPLRSAFDKINQNFTEVYGLVGVGGSSNQLVNGDYSVTLDSQGNVQIPPGGQLQLDGTSFYIQRSMGSHIVSDYGLGIDTVDKTDPQNPIYHSWAFGSDGKMYNSEGFLLNSARGTLAIGTDMETPGVPQHFHIAFENSNTTPAFSDLFLGDDYNFVQIHGQDGAPYYGVKIGTNDRAGGQLYQWKFGTDGSITFPDASVQTTAYTGSTPTLATVRTISTSGPQSATVSDDIVLCDPNAAGGNINIVLPSNPPTGKTITVKNINSGGFNLYVQPNSPNGIETETGTVGVGMYATMSASGSTMTWVFANSIWRAINKFGV